MPDYFDKFHAVIKFSCADATRTVTLPSAKHLLKEAVELALHEMTAEEVSALVLRTTESMQASLSKPRRKAGDKVYVEDGAGFGTQAGACVIQEESGPLNSCPMCGNLACREWGVLAQVDALDRPTGERAYHVSECDMHDAPPEGQG